MLILVPQNMETQVGTGVAVRTSPPRRTDRSAHADALLDSRRVTDALPRHAQRTAARERWQKHRDWPDRGSGSPDLQGELSEMVLIECPMRRRRTIQ
jgi:hypothetical protein